jgi:hypothetical protein
MMKLELIDFSNIRLEQVDLVNSAFGLWRETFDPILEKAGETLHTDGFFRAKIASVIHTDGHIHSFSLSNILDLRIDGVNELGYFHEMPKPLLGEFVNRGTRLMTIEWVTVHPEMRLKLTKIQQADLIMGCSIRALLSTECDGAIGYSRIDLGADRIASRFGAKAQATVMAHGIECNVMLARREWVTAHKFKVVQSSVDDLWTNKLNTTALISDTETKGGADEVAA